jgi:DNA modification methylase
MEGLDCRRFLDGRVTLYLGDCLDVLNRMPEASVDHVMSDPPYESHMHTAKAGARGGKRANSKDDLAAGRISRTDGQDPLKTLDFESIEAIRPVVTRLMVKVSAGWLIAFCTPEGVAPWRDAIEAAGARYKRACVWVKPDAPPQFNGQGPAMGAENFVAAWCGKGWSRWNAGGKRGVYTHLTNGRTRDGRHPTEKPIELMRELLRDFTKPDDLILDPFMGSGTTAVACVLENRRFVGIELNANYFAIACQRVEWALNADGPVARRVAAAAIGPMLSTTPNPDGNIADLFGA